jgi:hypothetical protein
MGEIVSAKDVQAVVIFVRLLSPAFEQYNRLCAPATDLTGIQRPGILKTLRTMRRCRRFPRWSLLNFA